MAKIQKDINKLKDRCEILEKVIISISDIYKVEANDDQKRLIETILGAAIWYLPHGEKYWTGEISEGAIHALKHNPNPRLTKEHQFPRKIAAKELLNQTAEISTKEASLLKLYEEKYAKFNYVTPEENKRISRHQRDDVFVDIEKAYKLAEIKLKKITKNDLKKMRKGLSPL